MLSGIFNLSYAQSDSVEVSPADTAGFVMHKSPLRAVAYSLLLPGMGQIYVESYWKAPLFIAGAGGLVYSIIWNHNRFSNYAEDVDRAIADGADPESNEVRLMKARREFYRDNRDLSGLYLIGVYALAAVDAYVGAHLFDFDVSDDLSLRFIPDYRSGLRLSVSYDFP